MELLRPEDRQRLLSIRKSSNPPSACTSSPGSGEASQPAVLSSGTSAEAPPLQQQEALAAWRGVHQSAQTFRPFEKNPTKQARYELYLSRLRLGDRGTAYRSHHALQEALQEV